MSAIVGGASTIRRFNGTSHTHPSAASMNASRPQRAPRRPPDSRQPAVARKTAALPQEVRLIGGRFKRTPLPVLTWPGLRPTSSRVRETLFNWLGQDLSGWRVLDAFAGSGALGLEAASRGATDVVLVERERRLSHHLEAQVQRLKAEGVSVVTSDALGWMRHCALRHPQGRFDLVFLDPPFDAELFDAALASGMACVTVTGWIYLEAPHPIGQDDAHPLPAGLRLHRHGRAGAVHYHLIQRVDSATPGNAGDA